MDLLHFIKKAWDQVSEATIVNGFEKARFIIDDGSQENDPEPELEEFEDDRLPICDDLMNDFNEDSNEEISYELNINHEEKNDPYFEVS